jgi:hypothetical protein
MFEGRKQSGNDALLPDLVRTIAWVTPITADPCCKEQNSAGFGDIFRVPWSQAFIWKRTRPQPWQAA